METPRHPAKYSDALLPLLEFYLEGYDKILDPFAGTGKLKQVRPDAVLLELEPEWAEIEGAVVGDAHHLPFASNYFDAISTSCCYGNRMSDHFTDHQPEKRYTRNTYTHALGRKLSKNNSGALQWGHEYRQFHVIAWVEAFRVMRHGARFILNISDHIRNGEAQPVSKWHLNTLLDIGLCIFRTEIVKTPRLRQGQNSKARVDHENIFVFWKP